MGIAQQVMANTHTCYVAVTDKNKPLVAIGLYKRGTLCGTVTDIWALVCEECFGNLAHWRELKKLSPQLKEKFPHIQTHVHIDNLGSQRFLKFFGFEETERAETIITYEVH